MAAGGKVVLWPPVGQLDGLCVLKVGAGGAQGRDSAQTLLPRTEVRFPALPVSFLSSSRREEGRWATERLRHGRAGATRLQVPREGREQRSCGGCIPQVNSLQTAFECGLATSSKASGCGARRCAFSVADVIGP